MNLRCSFEATLFKTTWAQPNLTAHHQRLHLDHEAIAILQAGKQRAGVFRDKEIATQRVQRPLEIE